MADKISGLAVASIGAGALFLYAGITGKDIPAALQAVVSGKSPTTAPVKYGITGSSASSSSSSGFSGSTSGYANPFRSVANLVPERIDQGVDYSGSGPVYALGPGKIVAIYNPGWPGGGWIVVHLSSGGAKNRYWYVAENIAATVQVGQQVDSSTVIGQMNGGIECGWAAPPGAGVSLALVNLQFSGANSTAYGKNASDLLASLGAPAGIVQAGGIRGTVPFGFPAGG